MDEESYTEMQVINKTILLQLHKGELEWSDEKVQFFIPAALFHTDFDWLNLCAENMLIEEDEKVVKNFLEQVQALMKVNADELNRQVEKKLKKLGFDL